LGLARLECPVAIAQGQDKRPLARETCTQNVEVAIVVEVGDTLEGIGPRCNLYRRGKHSFDLAARPNPPDGARAGVFVHAIDTDAVVLARIRRAIIDVVLAIDSIIARIARTHIAVDLIGALSVDAGARCAFVDVRFAVRPLVPRRAFANVRVDSIEAVSAVLTGARRAFVDFRFAVRPGVTRRACTRVAARVVRARAAILAGARVAMVRNVRRTCAVRTREPITTRHRRITRRVRGQTAGSLAIRIVHCDVIARVYGVRIHTRLLADLQNRVRLRRRRRAVTNLHLPIDRKIIALLWSQCLLRRANVLIGMLIRRGGTPNRHASQAEERQHCVKSCFENRGGHRSFPFFHQGKGSSQKPCEPVTGRKMY